MTGDVNCPASFVGFYESNLSRLVRPAVPAYLPFMAKYRPGTTWGCSVAVVQSLGYVSCILLSYPKTLRSPIRSTNNVVVLMSPVAGRKRIM